MIDSTTTGAQREPTLFVWSSFFVTLEFYRQITPGRLQRIIYNYCGLETVDAICCHGCLFPVSPRNTECPLSAGPSSEQCHFQRFRWKQKFVPQYHKAKKTKSFSHKPSDRGTSSSPRHSYSGKKKSSQLPSYERSDYHGAELRGIFMSPFSRVSQWPVHSRLFPRN